MSKERIKTVFIGTSDFGIPALRALTADPFFNLRLVISQPDKKAGRGQSLKTPPVKDEAAKLGLPVIQPKKIITALAALQSFAPDLIVVAAYGQILPEKILDLPRFGCVNIHGSLLPKCRGAACIAGAILSGEKETGVTIMLMDKGLDTGPLLAQQSLPIKPADTAGDLFGKLSALAADLLIATLKDHVAGKIKPVKQNSNSATYFPTMSKTSGRIDWSAPAAQIERFIRAMTPWPGAFCYMESNEKQSLRIIEADPRPSPVNNHQPGVIFSEQGELLIQCGKNALVIIKLQLPGKKPVTGPDFLRGYKKYLGQKLI